MPAVNGLSGCQVGLNYSPADLLLEAAGARHADLTDIHRVWPAHEYGYWRLWQTLVLEGTHPIDCQYSQISESEARSHLMVVIGAPLSQLLHNLNLFCREREGAVERGRVLSRSRGS